MLFAGAAVQWEVEQKFAVPAGFTVDGIFSTLGVPFGAAIPEVDLYFNHPLRDFAATDEALRLRRSGESNYITYKGPRIDTTTKTRKEIELPLPKGENIPDQYQQLLVALGFRPVGSVEKLRRAARTWWEGHDVHLTWDEVALLGNYLELEIIADDAGLAAAKKALESLARKLSLGASERRSYLELTLSVNAK